MPLTTIEAAERLGVTQQRIRQYLSENRIPGAQKIGRDWVVPDEFEVLPSARPIGRQAKPEEDPPA